MFYRSLVPVVLPAFYESVVWPAVGEPRALPFVLPSAFAWGCEIPFFLRIGPVGLEEGACRFKHRDGIDEGLSSEVFRLHVAAVNQLLAYFRRELSEEVICLL